MSGFSMINFPTPPSGRGEAFFPDSSIPPAATGTRALSPAPRRVFKLPAPVGPFQPAPRGDVWPGLGETGNLCAGEAA